MSEERLKEIKDSIDLDYDFCRKYGFEFAKPQRELELYNEVIRLKKRNKEIYEGFLATQEEMSDYATRIEKAVEYLKEMDTQLEVYGDYDILSDNKNDLLNILNGRSDE